MFGFSLVVVERIVQVVLQVLVEEWREHLVHISLETGRGIRKSKGHDSHVIGTEWRHKRRFPFVPWANPNLIITGFQIELHEDFRTTDSIHHFVNLR
jgi:hypothetical protein